MTKLLDVAESSFVNLPESRNECSDTIDSNRDLELQRKDPTNPLAHIIEKLEKTKRKKKLSDFMTPIFPTPLQWIEALKDGEVCAEILCSSELIQVD